jgi:EAL domain-containing protein (putative c-di-GMP-specific phosphodiesterase class I)
VPSPQSSANSLTLFVNVEPDTPALVPRELRELVDRAATGLRIVLEVTERAVVQQPAELLRLVDWARERSWGIALDDIGEEPGSLAMMPFLEPDVIKLDLRLVQQRPTAEIGLIMSAVLAQSERTGAAIVAEGVEDDGMREAALALGATLAQGWMFGRPGALPDKLPPVDRVVPLHRSWSQRDDPTPFSLVRAALPVRRAGKQQLLNVAAHLEEQAGAWSDGPVVLSTFSDGEQLEVSTAERYRRLAGTGSFVAALRAGGALSVGTRRAQRRPAGRAPARRRVVGRRGRPALRRCARGPPGQRRPGRGLRLRGHPPARPGGGGRPLPAPPRRARHLRQLLKIVGRLPSPAARRVRRGRADDHRRGKGGAAPGVHRTVRRSGTLVPARAPVPVVRARPGGSPTERHAMKADIHPTYVDTTVTCTCGNTFTTRSTETSGSITPTSARLPPVLHGQAEDPRHRWPRGPVRAALRQALQVADPAAPVPAGGGRRCRVRTTPEPGQERHGETVGTPDRQRAGRARRARGPAGRPVGARRPGARPRAGPRYAELGRWSPRSASRRRSGATSAAREMARRTPRSAAEARQLEQQVPRLEARIRELLVPRDPADAKDVILEVKAGEGGDESALFAGDLVRCTPATRSSRAGRPRWSAPPRASSAATRTSRSP